MTALCLGTLTRDCYDSRIRNKASTLGSLFSLAAKPRPPLHVALQDVVGTSDSLTASRRALIARGHRYATLSSGP